MTRFALLALLMVPAWLVAGTDTVVGSLRISGPWSRPTAPVGAMAAAYLTITNLGTRSDRLVGASTPAAGSAEIDESRLVNGISQMRTVASLEIPPGQTVRLEPGALHIMLMDLPRALEPGSQYPLTLKFRDAGAITVQVQVRSPP